MADAIVHRGPDESGFFVDEGIGLAFRRLRIIDLATGSQPIANEDGSVVVVFNGEIYNYRELRDELKARGHRFSTASDTEVLVHLYEECGERLLQRLNGMFAFAIWDQRRQRVLLARDPVGIKPLLYSETNGGLFFASEMGAIAATGHLDTSIDPVGLHLYLSWGAIPAPRTIYRRVRRLPPAHFLIWENGTARVQRYWHALERDATAPASFDEAQKYLRELLDDSVRRQIVSDVPLGAFLSGGVDSTSIVGLMRPHVATTHTFSIGFAGNPIFDETRYARAAATFHHTHHSEAQLGEADVRQLIPEILNGASEPFGSASLLPTFAVSRKTREKMTVALSGDGADELFAGYDRYLGETMLPWIACIPRALRESILAPAVRALPATRAHRTGEWGRKARRLLEGIEPDPAIRHDRWMHIAPPADIRALLGLSGAATEEANPGLAIIREVHAEYDARGLRDAMNRVLFTDFSIALPTDMLLKVDLASMRNSLEVRVPFLDPRIVQAAFAMPSSWKIRGMRRKIILKEAVRDLLPAEIQHRPKAGFDVPVGEWIKGPMREMFQDVVRSAGSIPLDRARIDQLYEEHTSGRADRAKILWAMFALRWWERARQQSIKSPAAAHPLHEPAGVLT
jgi:asparagine synthase (glutamine-hydrolysing)